MYIAKYKLDTINLTANDYQKIEECWNFALISINSLLILRYILVVFFLLMEFDCGLHIPMLSDIKYITSDSFLIYKASTS
jgi:hypothetical protein